MGNVQCLWDFSIRLYEVIFNDPLTYMKSLIKTENRIKLKNQTISRTTLSKTFIPSCLAAFVFFNEISIYEAEAAIKNG